MYKIEIGKWLSRGQAQQHPIKCHYDSAEQVASKGIAREKERDEDAVIIDTPSTRNASVLTKHLAEREIKQHRILKTIRKFFIKFLEINKFTEY